MSSSQLTFIFFRGVETTNQQRYAKYTDEELSIMLHGRRRDRRVHGKNAVLPSSRQRDQLERPHQWLPSGYLK